MVIYLSITYLLGASSCGTSLNPVSTVRGKNSSLPDSGEEGKTVTHCGKLKMGLSFPLR